jgi:mono/diheme cytochrome c family protein
VKAFIAGLIIGVLLVIGGVYFYFTSGRAPAAVEDKPMPLERKLANGALHAHINREMPKSAPIAADEGTYTAGAQIYDQHCGLCHGFPNMDQGAMPKGMFPKPPQLFKGTGVTDDPAGETYWKVANGIRLTAMPEFKHILNDTQIWQVSVLLANADKISDAVKQQLKPGFPGGAMPPGGEVSPGGPAPPGTPPARSPKAVPPRTH